MINSDFPAFESELKQLCAAVGPPRFSPPLAQAYWRVLRDTPLAEIVANVERILSSATRETKFPTPAELRNHVAQAKRTPAMEEQLASAEALNARMWPAFQRIDPELCAIELNIAQAGRILATDHESTERYQQALAWDRRSRDERTALWAQRASASA